MWNGNSQTNGNIVGTLDRFPQLDELIDDRLRLPRLDTSGGQYFLKARCQTSIARSGWAGGFGQTFAQRGILRSGQLVSKQVACEIVSKNDNERPPWLAVCIGEPHHGVGKWFAGVALRSASFFQRSQCRFDAGVTRWLLHQPPASSHRRGFVVAKGLALTDGQKENATPGNQRSESGFVGVL